MLGADQESALQVTLEQIAYFETFGFLIRKQLLSPEEMESVTREADKLFAEDLRSSRGLLAEPRQHFVTAGGRSAVDRRQHETQTRLAHIEGVEGRHELGSQSLIGLGARRRALRALGTTLIHGRYRDTRPSRRGRVLWSR